MGYRLEISASISTDCGGKLFGYISEEDLHTCESWKWLKEHHYIDEKDENLWDYGFDHHILMNRDEFKEFIALYIKDYNRLSPYGNKLSICDFKESLKYEWLNVEWF